MAGLTLAARAGQAGLNIALINPALDAGGADTRTTAISYGSMRILQQAGIWQNLEQNEICAIERIDVLDGRSPVLLRFIAEQPQDKAFGWIVLNRDLLRAAHQALRDLANVQLIKGIFTSAKAHQEYVEIHLADHTQLQARLVIGADGRGSKMRAAMNVRVREWSYRQRAIICTAAHEHSHQNTAIEHFWPEGPFAILPMTDAAAKDRPRDDQGRMLRHRSAVVFTEHGLQKTSWLHLRPEVFAAAIAARFPDRYGAVQPLTQPVSYPLGLIHASSYIAPRMALVADAAHGIHPIAGQGLNIGLRDVAALSDLLTEAARQKADPGVPALLEMYQRQRRFDVTTMAAATDGLNRLFSNASPPVRALRRAGLALVERMPAAKSFFIRRAMGDF